MDLVAFYILCVSVLILFLGILSYMWLKIIEYQLSAIRARTVPQNFGFPMEGPIGNVERYIVTVTTPIDNMNRGESAAEA